MPKITIIISIIIAYCFDIPGYAVGDTWQVFVYMFAHDNIFHLASNMYCLWYVLNDKVHGWVTQFLLCYAAAVASMYMFPMDVQTTGFSGFICAQAGLNLAYSCDRKGLLLFVGMLLMTALIFPNVNGYLHFAAFLMAYTFEKCYRLFHEERG